MARPPATPRPHPTPTRSLAGGGAGDDPAAWTVGDWSRFLEEELHVPVTVAYGRSRTVPVQARAARVGDRSGLDVRMHRMFALAPSEVRDALARWLRVGRRARRAGERLDQWIQAALAESPAPSRRGIRLEPEGRFHDLGELATPLFLEAFAGDFAAEVERPSLTWGRRSRSRSRRSLRLGSYELETRIVRVHPVLDQEGVPDWFVRFVLMHEILHAVHPPRLVGRRWVHHGPEFRARERAYPDYTRAVRWEEKHLGRLIRAARTGASLAPARRSKSASTPSAPPAAKSARQLDLFP